MEGDVSLQASHHSSVVCTNGRITSGAVTTLRLRRVRCFASLHFLKFRSLALGLSLYSASLEHLVHEYLCRNMWICSSNVVF